MNAARSSMEELQSKVQELLKREGVKTVAVIDDAYLPPKPAEIRDELNEFIDELVAAERTQELADLCGLQNREIRDSSAFNDNHVQSMWKYCTGECDDEIINELRVRVFQAHLDDLRPVEFIRRTLSALGLEVRALPPQDDAFTERADMWMLDLFWEQVASNMSGTSEVWHRTAEFARTQFNGQKPPVFVLMSSYRKSLEERRIDFRSRAKLPAGTFHIWHKRSGDSDDDDMALLRWLANLLENAPFQRQVFELVQAIEISAEKAVAEYRKSLHALAPEDYAHIYRYSLEEEGHPLGDYVLWLLEPLFEFHLRQHTHVRELRDKLDRLSSTDVPFYECLERPPSTALGGIHQLRIWQEIDRPFESIQAHGIPRVHQGDLLVDVNADERVFLVLNADCDLAFSEAGGSRSEPRKELSVLLLPGIVESFGIETKTDGQTAFIDFYNDAKDGTSQAYRIRWSLGQVLTRPYRDITPKSYSRRWRLRRPFLSKLVQRWSHHVTREGAPVGPPVIEKLHVSKVFWRASKRESWQTLLLQDGPHEGYLFSRIDDKGKKANKLVMRDRERLLAALHELALDKSADVLSVVASRLHTDRDLNVPDESKRVSCGQKILLCLYDIALENVSDKVQLIILLDAPERAS